MTVTESAPAPAPATSEPPAATTPAPTGLAAILGSGDHKVVGRLWIVASLFHLLLAGLAALAVAAEKIDLSGVEKQSLARYTNDAGNHVLIEVHAAA